MRLINLDALNREELHLEAVAAGKRHAESEYHLIRCLVSVERRGVHRQKGCGTTVQYAVQYLHLDPHKAREMLRVGRVLRERRRLERAYREGRLSWSKVREVTRVVTAENEDALVDFALRHSAAQVEARVACSPARWKKMQREAAAGSEPASGPSLCAADAPGVGLPVEQGPKTEGAAAQPGLWDDAGSEVAEPVAACTHRSSPALARVPGLGAGPGSPGPAANPGEGAGGTTPARTSTDGVRVAASVEPGSPAPGMGALASTGSAQESPVPFVPLILFKRYLEPEHLALVEQAENRVRARLGGRPAQGKVLAEMARVVLSAGDARSRVRYQVYLHVDGITGQGWLDTDRGLLPAPAELVAEALRQGRVEEVSRSAITQSTGFLAPGSSTWKVHRAVVAAVRLVEGPTVGQEASPEEVCLQASPSFHEPGALLEGEGCPGVPGESAPVQKMPVPQGMAINPTSTWKSPEPAPESPNLSPEHPEGAARRAGEAIQAPADSPERTEATERPPTDGSPTRKESAPARRPRRRQAIPAPTLRKLYARAGGRCEDCGRRVPLDSDHLDAYSEHGTHDAERMRLRCRACHALRHEPDFASRPDWARARAQRMRPSAEPLPGT